MDRMREKRWPAEGISRVPYWIYTDPEIYAEEERRIFGGPSWNYVALEAELPNPGDYKRSYAGGRSVVVNMPITHPPRPIDGVLVSGMPVPPGLPYTDPRSLADELDADGYITDVAVREDNSDGIDTLARLRDMTAARGRAVVRLAQRESWDLFVAVFVLPDRLGHPWWKYLVEGDALFSSREGARIRAAAAEALAALDRAIADLVAVVPSNAAIVACSDHGFGSLRADVFFDVALADAGLIERTTGSAVLSRLGRSPLARVLPNSIRTRGRDALAGRDTERRAYTAPPYECGVRVQHAGDVDRVAEVLLSVRDPDGAPVVASVRRREHVYSGDYVERAPELLLELRDESVDVHDGLHAPTPWVSRADVAWGTHRVDGIVAVQGAPMTSKGTAPDVAATVLELLGLRVDGLDGRSLVASSGDHTAVSADAPASTDAVYNEDEEAAVFEHLKGLGYVD